MTCDCTTYWQNGHEVRILCPLHANAQELLEVLKECINGINCQPGYVRSLTIAHALNVIAKAEGGK